MSFDDRINHHNIDLEDFRNDFEEELEEPITDPAPIQRYLNKQTGHIFEFQKFPNLGKYRKFENQLITNYVVTTVRLGDETIYGKIIMPKQMSRIIEREGLVPLD
jgi:hypothetical protein